MAGFVDIFFCDRRLILHTLQDYEAAAGHVAMFMQLEATLGGAALSGIDAGQVESQRQVGLS